MVSWLKSLQRRRSPCNCPTASLPHFSSRTSPCPSVVQRANWALIASLTSSCGGSTQGGSGSASLCQQTPLGHRPFTTRPSTKSVPKGPMMGRSGKHSWPVWPISLQQRHSTAVSSMATGRTPWPTQGGWHWLLRLQTPKRGEGHRHDRSSWRCAVSPPRGTRQ